VQFYIISPFIMLVALKRPRLGYVLMAALILLCIALRGGLSLAYGYQNYQLPPVSYSDVVYNKVWTRMSPYVMGMVVAMLNRRHFSLRRDIPRPFWVQLLWFGGLAVALAVMVLEVYWWQQGEMTPAVRLMHIALHRSLFGASTVFLISAALAVRRGDGLLIDATMRAYRWLMGTRFFFVFATLSYPMYLIHVPIMVGFVMWRNLKEITMGLYLSLWAEHIAMVFVLALLLHLFVEKPWMNMRC
jgi:peptidoglycan/LPS O-acetylase OafA/YrhL